jgi:hypothetical protein
MQRWTRIVLAGSCIAALACFRPAAHQNFPAMQKGAGRTLGGATLVSIVVEGDPVAKELFAFADALIRSSWWSSFGDGYALTAPASSVHATGPALPSDNVSDGDMIAYVQRLIAAGLAPSPDGKTIYVLYLPFGVTPANDGCERLVGYHEAFDSQGDAFAVLLRCEVPGPTLVDDLTVAASHEIAESVSDPLPGTAWTLPPSPPVSWNGSPWQVLDFLDQDEIGDLCTGNRIREGAYLYQRIWSPTAQSPATEDPCVPASREPYFATSSAQEWVEVTPGTSAEVALTGWSAAPTADWEIIVTPIIPLPTETSASSFGFQLRSKRSVDYDGMTVPVLNNGEVATLTVTVPRGMTSGNGFVLQVSSFRSATVQAMPPPDTDLQHVTYLGAYVK